MNIHMHVIKRTCDATGCGSFDQSELFERYNIIMHTADITMQAPCEFSNTYRALFTNKQLQQSPPIPGQHGKEFICPLEVQRFPLIYRRSFSLSGGIT